MSDLALERWLHSGKPVQLNSRRLWPLNHSLNRGVIAVAQGGQAEVVFLRGQDGSKWVAKRFKKAQRPERDYLASVTRLLPAHPALASGTQRELLSAGDMTRAFSCHYSKDLARWFDGCLLMPQIGGLGWGALADELRTGQRQLSVDQRGRLCRNLSGLVDLLEAKAIAHRDLSCGNVRIYPETLEIHLIDFDSVYHSSLSMPSSTTSGTTGYMPAFIWKKGVAQPGLTWRCCADRFALGLLNAEFLLLDRGDALQGDGGLFSQDDLCRNAGRSLESATRRLGQTLPAAGRLLERTLRSTCYESCPSPADWIHCCDALAAPNAPLPSQCVPSCQLGPQKLTLPDATGTGLSDLLWEIVTMGPSRRHVVPLPADPWAKNA